MLHSAGDGRHLARATRSGEDVNVLCQHFIAGHHVKHTFTRPVGDRLGHANRQGILAGRQMFNGDGEVGAIDVLTERRGIGDGSFHNH